MKLVIHLFYQGFNCRYSVGFNTFMLIWPDWLYLIKATYSCVKKGDGLVQILWDTCTNERFAQLSRDRPALHVGVQERSDLVHSIEDINSLFHAQHFLLGLLKLLFNFLVGWK